MVVDIDAPDFTIIEMTDSNLKSVMVDRDDIAGKPLFSVFPDTKENNYTKANWVRDTLEKVITGNRMITTQENEPLRYDIPDKNGNFAARYWHIRCTPYFGSKGSLYAITVMGLDVTDMVANGLINI